MLIRLGSYICLPVRFFSKLLVAYSCSLSQEKKKTCLIKKKSVLEISITEHFSTACTGVLMSRGNLPTRSECIEFNQKQNTRLVFIYFTLFVGPMSGGFNFQVNDGVNFTPRQIFSITARALVIILEKNHPLKVFPGK